jgi:hypothetical protein
MPSDVCKDIRRSVIHPSAWHWCSRKSRFSVLHNPVPIREKQGFETSQKPRLSTTPRWTRWAGPSRTSARPRSPRLLLGRARVFLERRANASDDPERLWTLRRCPTRWCSSVRCFSASTSSLAGTTPPDGAAARCGGLRRVSPPAETASRCTGNHTRGCGQNFLPPMTGRDEPLIDRHARGPRSTRADGSRARPSVENRRAWALKPRSSLRARGAEACQGLLRYGAGWILGWRQKLFQRVAIVAGPFLDLTLNRPRVEGRWTVTSL